jgi:hypothetical protein
MAQCLANSILNFPGLPTEPLPKIGSDLPVKLIDKFSQENVPLNVYSLPLQIDIPTRAGQGLPFPGKDGENG